MIARLVLMFCGAVFATEAPRLESVKVSGEKAAEIRFQLSPTPVELPVLKVNGNTIEVSFPGTQLAESGRIDLSEVHVLLQHLSVVPAGDAVKARLVVKGDVRGLRDRIRLATSENGILMQIALPEKGAAALQLLHDEQQPLTPAATSPTLATSGGERWQLVAALVLFVAVLGGCLFGMQFLKRQGRFRGTRKYLVEQLSYHPLGPKTGVSLLKVGGELVLIGITPQQITFLSSVPRLQEQYHEENQLERGAFKTAVEEEFRRVKEQVA